MEPSTTRNPKYAGQFYPQEFDTLDKEITNCFMKGPGDIPIKKRNKKLLGVIIPHAGYAFSGPTAAWAYKEIGESEFPDTYIILGTNHHSHTTSTSNKDWKTPLGLIRCDVELARKLKEEGIPISNEEHANEHSIEVQLPFLQFVSKDNLRRLKILPLLVGSSPEETAQKLKKCIKALERKTILITSSDFTHYGRGYGYIPFETDVKKRLEDLDKGAISYIIKKDIPGFLNYIGYNQATICGTNPIITLIEFFKDTETETKLLHYTTSGDVTGDYKTCVGYAAITIEKK